MDSATDGPGGSISKTASRAWHAPVRVNDVAFGLIVHAHRQVGRWFCHTQCEPRRIPQLRLGGETAVSLARQRGLRGEL